MEAIVLDCMLILVTEHVCFKTLIAVPTKLFQKVLTLGEHMDDFSVEMSLTLTILTWLWALAWFESIYCFYPKSCKWIWCPLWSGSFESTCLVRNKRITLGVLWSPDLNSFSVPDLNPSNFFQLQFSSVTQSCPTLCDPMNLSMPGLSVHHQLLEFTQTRVHRVHDAIQPSHPLSSPSPPASDPSHQGPFQWVNSSHEVAKVLEFQL